MAVKVTKEQRELIEYELRRGTSRSRICNLLEMEYDDGIKLIEAVQESIRPEIGDKIKFEFRGNPMVGIIIKLLDNSAIVKIYWDKSDTSMEEVLEDRTVVNFKDIIEFVSLPKQPEDEDLVLDPQPTIIEEGVDGEEADD